MSNKLNALLFALWFAAAAAAQSRNPLAVRPHTRVRVEIDNQRTVRLRGDQHPLARVEYDRGAVPPDHSMERMILTLQSDPEQQAALEALLAAQHDPDSPQFQQWLTPESFAERFGVAQQDLDQVVAWLEAQGFQVEEIPAGGRSVIFSGNAAQVESAFHTEIHRYQVAGRRHHANASDPQIPQALAGVVGGIVSLHDFPKQSLYRNLSADPANTAGSTHYLAAADFATIYHVGSLYSAGYTGAGVNIAIVGRTNIRLTDVQSFRRVMGLTPNSPTIIVNGRDPGVVSQGEEMEADLDVQWSGAVAPMAAIKFVISASTSSADGVDLSAQYIVSHNLAPVMSLSFGLCEAYLGSTGRSFYNSLWQQAAAQGITVLVASGDNGAAGCDGASATTGTHGPAVNGLCSTPYSVCVGGTQFSDTAFPAMYWSPSNTSAQGSALSYIPEVVWNESGPGSGLWASGGGASLYYTKPSWQSGVGVPADGQRDVPDVSLSAAGHDAYLVYLEGGRYAVSGTSAAAPAFAGLMALVNQKTSARQGNANTVLYALASRQNSGGAACFHDIRGGTNSVPGVAGFSAGTGYDLGTGLGSVDADVLVNHWTDASPSTPSFLLTATPTALTVSLGNPGSVTAAVTVSGGFSNRVALSASGVPTGVTAAFGPASLTAPGSGSSTLTFTAGAAALPGTYSVTISAVGGNLTRTATVSLTVAAAPACTLVASPASLSLPAGSSSTVTVVCSAPQAGFATLLNLTARGAPAGTTVTFSPASILPGTGKSTMTVTVADSADPATATITLTAATTDGKVNRTTAISLAVKAPMTFTLAGSTSSLSVPQGNSGRVTFTTAHVGAFNSPLTLTVSGAPSGVTATFSTGTIAAPGDGSSVLTVQANASAPPGGATLTIAATGGGIAKSVRVSITIPTSPNFTFSVGAPSLSVAQGSSATATLSTTGLVGGFNSAVALSVAQAGSGGLPVGLTANLTPSSLAAPGSGSGVLRVSASASAAARSYTLVVTAAGGGVSKSVNLTVNIAASAAFSLQTTSGTAALARGSGTTVTLHTTVTNRFAAPVQLAAAGLPSGVTASFSPAVIANPESGSSTLRLTGAQGAARGTQSVVVTASGGGLSRSVSVSLTVN